MELERKQPGTGLGLYIVRTLVGRLGGRIRVHDRAQGPGTVFEVVLPASPRKRSAAGIGERHAALNGSSAANRMEVG
jgi:K+-sensing histidine kinase KdpD